MSTRRFLRPSLLIALGLCLSCNAFVQNPGAYELTTTEIVRDDCRLQDAEDWERRDGSLLITGQVVRMDFDLLDMQLVGRFQAGGETFEVDGSVANAPVLGANKEPCVVDQVSVHLEGNTVCATRFDGVLRVRYEARRPESCICEMWVRYEAVQDGARCEAQP